jgi:hypothetical protein
MITGVELTKSGIQGRSGATGPEIWQARVWHALRHLDDRSILNQSPLARLTCIQRLADTKFKGNALVKGLALKHILIECVDRLVVELCKETGLIRTCQLLRLVEQGQSITSISRSLGLSREHVTRVYKKKAVELVTQEFLAIVGHPGPIAK